MSNIIQNIAQAANASWFQQPMTPDVWAQVRKEWKAVEKLRKQTEKKERELSERAFQANTALRFKRGESRKFVAYPYRNSYSKYLKQKVFSWDHETRAVFEAHEDVLVDHGNGLHDRFEHSLLEYGDSCAYMITERAFCRDNYRFGGKVLACKTCGVIRVEPDGLSEKMSSDLQFDNIRALTDQMIGYGYDKMYLLKDRGIIDDLSLKWESLPETPIIMTQCGQCKPSEVMTQLKSMVNRWYLEERIETVRRVGEMESAQKRKADCENKLNSLRRSAIKGSTTEMAFLYTAGALKETCKQQ